MNQFETTGSIGSVLDPFRWDLLGFGICRAWVTSFLAFAANEIWISGASLDLQVVLFVPAALIALTLALISKNGLPSRLAHKELSITLICTAIGILGMACAMLGKLDSAETLLFFGFVLIGMCCGFFETVWGIKFTKLPSSGIQVYTLFVMAISSLLGIAMGLLPSAGFFISSFILFGAMAAMLLVKFPPTGTNGSVVQPDTSLSQERFCRQSKRALTNILLCFFIFSLIYNLVVTITYSALPSNMASQIRFWANLIAALILLCSLFLFKPISGVTLFRLILPITAIGFVLYLIAPTNFGEIALMISSIGRKFFDILTWVLVAQTVGLFGFSATRYFGFLNAAKNAGYALGLIFAGITLSALDAQTVQTATVISILILALIVCFFWIFPERTIDNLFNALPTNKMHEAQQETTEARALGLAAKYKLTPRETEVFLYMARGRNLPAIAEKLQISRGTAHTHMAHIRQKLEVHNQQELIEMVEKFDTAEQDN